MSVNITAGGLFIISLDFELMWGVRDLQTLESYGINIQGVRKALPAMLDLFAEYDIHASFATVGLLMCRNKKELYQHIPSILPDYNLNKYSPFANNYLSTVGQSEEDDIFHYGPSLVQMILSDPRHEMGSHTFSHYYCLENASLQSFEADVVSMLAIAKTYGLDIRTIIFPRNQYSQEHINICSRYGICSYRGNEKSFIYQPRKNTEQSPVIRMLRLFDAYINISGHNTFNIYYPSDQLMVNIPSSRFLRPYSPGLRLLEPLRLRRIKNSMTYAARNDQAYHLWWHPHNFGVNLKENILFLKKVLQHFKFLQQQYGMKSMNMKEIAEGLLIKHEGQKSSIAGR